MKQRRIAAVLTGSLMTVAMGASVAPTAHAEPTGEPTLTPVEQSAVNYWTPDRMRNAKNVDLLRSTSDRTPTGRVEVGKERVIRSMAPNSQQPSAQRPSKVGGKWTKGGKVVKTTGKVFFHIPATEPSPGDYVCSGSVAPANNKSVIITAGHCVNDANDHAEVGDGKPGRYVTQWIFVPGYNGNAKRGHRAPYGVYAAKKGGLKASKKWINGANFNYDVGFATVGRAIGGDKDGSLVGNAHGSQALGFNLPRHKYVENFGYPEAYPYDGTRLDYSAGPALNADVNGTEKGNSTKHDDPGGSNDQVVRSNLTGGSSGGPWFYNFSESKGIGTQMSVNSFSYENLSAKQQRIYKIPYRNMWGPYFGTAIEHLFDSVQGRAPRATSRSVTTREDTATKITLSGTKSVATDHSRLHYRITSQPSHGKVTRSGHTATYTPDKNFNGTDRFTYVVNNGVNNSARAAVTINVTPVEDAPRAADDSYTVRAGKTLHVTAPGVLKNDHDADGDTLSAVLVGRTPDGLDFHSNGGFRYDAPTVYKNKTVTFTYRATDGVKDPNSARAMMSLPRLTSLAYSKDVTVTIAVAAARRPAPQPGPKPTQPPTSPQPGPSEPPASAAPSAQAPSGPLGDTGSPFSPALVVFGLLTVVAGAGTLIAARLRKS